ncbi:MAG TPA: hypothetical protein VGL32_07890 [Acidimicrobiales bacterium]
MFHANSSGQMVMTGFITGSTAAEGPYRAGQIPSSLEEVPSAGNPLTLSPSNPPAMYIPSPTDVYLPDGSGNRCTFASGQYPARWASGAALIPNTDDVLITYGDVCITGFGSIRAEGWGFLEYNWKTNAIDVGPDDVFPPARSGAALPPDLVLGSPVISNGQVSLFSFVCTSLYVSCNAGHVYAATLPDTTSALQSQSSYHVRQAATDASTTWQPMGIAVNSYPNAPMRMVETNAITGAYDVLTAKTATGPWHLETTGIVPNCLNVLSGFCRALVGQPELSTPSQLVITYYDPAAGPKGTSGPIGHMVGVGTSYWSTQAAPASDGAAARRGRAH